MRSALTGGQAADDIKKFFPVRVWMKKYALNDALSRLVSLRPAKANVATHLLHRNASAYCFSHCQRSLSIAHFVWRVLATF
jgi:hypothetical protein